MSRSFARLLGSRVARVTVPLLLLLLLSRAHDDAADGIKRSESTSSGSFFANIRRLPRCCSRRENDIALNEAPTRKAMPPDAPAPGLFIGGARSALGAARVMRLGPCSSTVLRRWPSASSGCRRRVIYQRFARVGPRERRKPSGEIRPGT